MNRELTNQILHLNHREFAIQEAIGRGASCVVYRAVCPDNTEHLLKEYNPRHIAMYREDNGELCLESEEDREAFEAGLARFREGHALQRRLRLDSDLKNSTSNIQEIYRANSTEYIDMTCFSGQSYEKVREKSIYDLMRRMKALTQVIGNYHKAGLLHLDIKPQNMFTIPETCELVMLFDFDSVVTKETAARGGAHSYSKDWSAPEQRNPLKRRSICEATDLFAVGEIIFWHLMGRNSTAEDHRSFATYTFEHNAPIFENVNPKVFPILDELLHHTICAPIDHRYQCAEDLIAKLDAIIKIADPKEPYLKSSALSMQDFFIGRDAEIQEIHDKLSKNRILFLSGIGGIGKSELAKHYVETHKADYDAIIFAPYVSNVNMLIADDIAIPIYNFQPYPEEKPQEYCTRKLRKLHELCDERTLLIVDNLDSDEDPDIPRLLELGCKLLITTRMDFSEYGLGQFLYIDALRNKTKIRSIFDKYYTKPLSADEEDCVEQIIDLVAGHTLTVELLAKQMMAGRVKPEAMLAKLQEGGISESGKEKVCSSKDGTFSAQNTYGHIQALFDLSELNNDEQYILANLSLIPYIGISTELFHNWCELEDYECINRLIGDGWIRFNSEQDCISLHPVLGDVCFFLAKDQNFRVQSLVRNSAFHSVQKLYTTYCKSRFNEVSRFVAKILPHRLFWTTKFFVCEYISDRINRLSSYAGLELQKQFVSSTDRYIAIDCTKKLLINWLNLFEDNSITTADCHRMLGDIYFWQKDRKIDSSFTSLNTALNICLNSKAPNELIIDVYLSLHEVYEYVSNETLATEQLDRALKYATLNSCSVEQYIKIYKQYSYFYMHKEQYALAAEYMLEAREYCKEGQEVFAEINFMLGVIYAMKGDTEISDRFVKEALAQAYAGTGQKFGQ